MKIKLSLAKALVEKISGISGAINTFTKERKFFFFFVFFWVHIQLFSGFLYLFNFYCKGKICSELVSLWQTEEKKEN